MNENWIANRANCANTSGDVVRTGSETSGSVHRGPNTKAAATREPVCWSVELGSLSQPQIKSRTTERGPSEKLNRKTDEPGGREQDRKKDLDPQTVATERPLGNHRNDSLESGGRFRMSTMRR